MQTLTQAQAQARQTVRTLGRAFDRDPDCLDRSQERKLFEAVALLERGEAIKERELILRIRRQKRG